MKKEFKIQIIKIKLKILRLNFDNSLVNGEQAWTKI